MKNRESCPICRSSGIDVVEEVSIDHLRRVWERHYPSTAHLWARLSVDRIQMLCCRECQLEWAVPGVVAEPLWYDVVAYPTVRWEYNVALARIDRVGSVIELGCGPGHFLSRAQEAGVDAIGFDTNDAFVQQARARGLTVFQGGLPEALALRDRRRLREVVVVAFHLFEHVADIHLLGSGLSKLAGEVHVSFPNRNRWTRYLLPNWMVGRREMWDYPPWHQSRWGQGSIAAFARGFGFDLDCYVEEPLSLNEVVVTLADETGCRIDECRALVKKQLMELAATGARVGGRSSYARLLTQRAS